MSKTVDPIRRVDISSFSIGLMLSWMTVSITLFSKLSVAHINTWSSENGISRDPLRESASSKSNAFCFSEAIWSSVSRIVFGVFDKRFSFRLLVQSVSEVLIVVERRAAFRSCFSMAASKILGIEAKTKAF